MIISTGKFTSVRRTWANRVRFQLGIGTFLAVLLPWLIRLQFAMQELEWIGLQASVLGSMLALVAGYYGFRRLSRYPGVRASRNIFPSFAVSYGAVLAFFFFARLDYSRLHFASSFVIAIAWYYIVYFKIQRQQVLRIGLVPQGDALALKRIKGVDWVPLDEPNLILGDVDAIAADLRADMPDEWERFLADSALAGMLVMHHKQIGESLTGRVEIEHLSENNFGSIIPGIVYGKVKRAGDFVVSLLCLPLLLPVMAAVAALIRLDSGGPILFSQQRMGHGGRPFTMYKFRSMRQGTASASDARSAAMTKDNDDRVTRVGRFIRRYRIDELPQVWNVLKGEMSWIGPRPEAVPLSTWYESELPYYRYRHIVRPGVTGWAQVRQGHVADVDDVLWKLHFDFYYIKNFSFWLDLLIIAGTIKTIISGHGAR